MSNSEPPSTQNKATRYSYAEDIEYQQPCPYCGKIIQYVSMVGAPGCVDGRCAFWEYHRYEHEALCYVLHFLDP